ncbi:MAG TPA: winged helix-turn-helix domain-containing protein [Blastocatellia bacterium]|nr:winged helix-turn-helix domain-containing protein [Blastocatellia bacterium]
MKDLLAQRASETFVGRADELGVLLSILDDGPRILFLHGIAGIGKSTLLERFTTQARARGAVVVSLNCQAIEPTERGFLHGLSAAMGGRISAADGAPGRLKSLGDRVVLSFDNYEVFRLMDTWLRQVFMPLLPDSVRTVFVVRDFPPPAGLVAPGWQGLVRTIGLEPLDEREAVELLLHSGAGAEDALLINRFAHGHPLALKLAATVGAERGSSDTVMTARGFQRVVEELTRLYLADVSDPLTRRALDAASVVRRITLSLLHAMLPDAAPQDAFDRLQSLPFVRSERDGLHLHDLVQQSIGASLRAVDPDRYQEYRRSAWRQLSTESRRTGLQELWRYTADLLYLIENPAVREAFFPTGGHNYVIEPAREEDGPAIRDLCVSHEPPEAVRLIETWWRQIPQAFQVARDQFGAVAGFYLMFDPSTIDQPLLRGDPVVEQWCVHLRRDPVPDNDRVLFLRRWLDREHGESPSPVQAACWLDIKRTYMQMRPRLRRVYISLKDLATYAPVAQRLGFQSFGAEELCIDGTSYSAAVLDFGPSSVDGWLAGLAAAELGLEDEPFDRQAHELVLDGNRVKLTKLEFEVFLYLYQRKGKAVTRASLIEDVWGWKQTGSNVIEAVVRSLRKKLGSRASAIETIRGSGYRFRGL